MISATWLFRVADATLYNLNATSYEEEFGNSDMMNLSPTKRIEALRSVAASLPVGKNLTYLQKIIRNLMEEERSSGYPMEPRQLTIAPSEYDVVITDISEGDIKEIGEILSVAHLSPVIGKPMFPVDGIMFGQNLRIFVPLIAMKKTISINVNFLFDTGSPISYMRKETFDALGIRENISSEVVVSVHGVTVQMHLSHGHFENVDIIGQDYLRVAGICATLNYAELMVRFTCGHN